METKTGSGAPMRRWRRLDIAAPDRFTVITVLSRDSPYALYDLLVASRLDVEPAVSTVASETQACVTVIPGFPGSGVPRPFRVPGLSAPGQEVKTLLVPRESQRLGAPIDTVIVSYLDERVVRLAWCAGSGRGSSASALDDLDSAVTWPEALTTALPLPLPAAVTETTGRKQKRQILRTLRRRQPTLRDAAQLGTCSSLPLVEDAALSLNQEGLAAASVPGSSDTPVAKAAARRDPEALDCPATWATGKGSDEPSSRAFPVPRVTSLDQGGLPAKEVRVIHLVFRAPGHLRADLLALHWRRNTRGEIVDIVPEWYDPQHLDLAQWVGDPADSNAQARAQGCRSLAKVWTTPLAAHVGQSVDYGACPQVDRTGCQTTSKTPASASRLHRARWATDASGSSRPLIKRPVVVRTTARTRSLGPVPVSQSLYPRWIRRWCAAPCSHLGSNSCSRCLQARQSLVVLASHVLLQWIVTHVN